MLIITSEFPVKSKHSSLKENVYRLDRVHTRKETVSSAPIRQDWFTLSDMLLC